MLKTTLVKTAKADYPDALSPELTERRPIRCRSGARSRLSKTISTAASDSRYFPILKDYQSHRLQMVTLLRDINPLGAVCLRTIRIISPAVVHDAVLRDSFLSPWRAAEAIGFDTHNKVPKYRLSLKRLTVLGSNSFVILVKKRTRPSPSILCAISHCFIFVARINDEALRVVLGQSRRHKGIAE